MPNKNHDRKRISHVEIAGILQQFLFQIAWLCPWGEVPPPPHHKVHIFSRETGNFRGNLWASPASPWPQQTRCSPWHSTPANAASATKCWCIPAPDAQATAEPFRAFFCNKIWKLLHLLVCLAPRWYVLVCFGISFGTWHFRWFWPSKRNPLRWQQSISSIGLNQCWPVSREPLNWKYISGSPLVKSTTSLNYDGQWCRNQLQVDDDS